MRLEGKAGLARPAEDAGRAGGLAQSDRDMLAVIWTHSTGATERQSVLAAVAETHSVSIDELDAAARDAALAGFRAGAGWRQGTDVDQLSAQEARVIADRLLRRVAVSTPTVQ